MYKTSDTAMEDLISKGTNILDYHKRKEVQVMSLSKIPKSWMDECPDPQLNPVFEVMYISSHF